MSTIKLPEITKTLVIELGESEEGQQQSVAFNWRLNALNRANYAAFMALQDEPMARAQRLLNDAMKADNANLADAIKPKSVKSKDATRYAKIDAALLGLAEDIERARAMTRAADRDEIFLDGFAEEVKAVADFREQLRENPTKTDEELEAETLKRRADAVEAYEIKLDGVAQMLAHLCASFRFNDGDRIECTVENLKEAFDADFIEQVISQVVVAMRAPLVTRGSTAA